MISVINSLIEDNNNNDLLQSITQEEFKPVVQAAFVVESLTEG